MAKAKKKRQQDFQKVKLKVGKKLKKGENVTNASFKTRSIQITQKLKAQNVTGPSTKKKQNIQEVLIQCRHYNANVRQEAMTGIREIVTTYPEITTTHLSDILEKSSELLSDKEGSVRQGCLRLFKIVLHKINEKQITPFFSMVCAHLCCAMTHINTDIQMDSLTMFDLLLEQYPRLMITEASQVMTNFVEQISRQKGGQRSLSTNLGHKMTSMKWRTSVLGRIEKFLMAFLNYHSNKQSDGGPESNVSWFREDRHTHLQICPQWVSGQWEKPGFVLRSLADAVDTTSDFDNKFSSFVEMLIPLLLECWIEALPSSQVSSGSDNALCPITAAILSSVLNVTKLLLDCVERLQAKQEGQKWMFNKSMKDFQQRLLLGFPYSSQEYVGSLTGKKVAEDLGPVAMLNLSVCEILTHFLPDHRVKSSPHPRWLTSDVLPYIQDFLSLKDHGAWNAGAGCKNVVKIVSKIMESGAEKEMLADILSAMFTRFKGASYLSQEKKVYMKFFSGIVFSSDSSDKISDELQYKFLRCLPGLFPLAVKESPKMAALLIQAMRVAACRNCLTFLDSTFFSKKGKEWFGEKDGAVTSLRGEDQRDLLSLLYFVPELDSNVVKLLTSLARSENMSEANVSFLIQVLHSRFSKTNRSTQECSLYMSFLISLLFGNTQDVEVTKVRNKSSNSIDKYSIVDTQHTHDSPTWGRHEFLVEETLKVISMLENCAQVRSIILNFAHSYLEKSVPISLQTSYGICKLASTSDNITTDVMSSLVHLSLSILISSMSCDLGSDVTTLTSIQTAVVGFLGNAPDAFNKFMSDVNIRITESPEDTVLILLKVCLVVLREDSRMEVLKHSATTDMFKQIMESLKAKEDRSTELEGLIADIEYRCLAFSKTLT